MSPFSTNRLRNLMLSGLFAGVAGLAATGASNPALAQYNPYCYAPNYNPYYCRYYSYGYGYPSYYGYNYPYYYGYRYPTYPYYGFAAGIPLGFGLGFGFGHPFYHREFRRFPHGFAARGVHHGFAARGVHHGFVAHGVHHVFPGNRGFAGAILQHAHPVGGGFHGGGHHR